MLESGVGKQYATCIYCEYLVDLDNNLVIIMPNNMIVKISSNGSYILANGIIVLVEEDIEAYENGTLIFYDKSSEVI